MVNLVVYLSRRELPSKETWEDNARAHRISLTFSGAFVPCNHPVTGNAEVDCANDTGISSIGGDRMRAFAYLTSPDPNTLVTANVGGATGQFGLELHELNADDKDFLRRYDQQAFEGFDFSAAFRWSERNRLDSMAAQLSAAALASATRGAVIWERT